MDLLHITLLDKMRQRSLHHTLLLTEIAACQEAMTCKLLYIALLHPCEQLSSQYWHAADMFCAQQLPQWASVVAAQQKQQ